MLLLSGNYLTAQNQEKFDLVSLEGRWHIVQTDFPMWLTGKRIAPTFNYKLLNKEKPVLSDKVMFLKNGKQKSISGFDHPTNIEQTAFVWRGKGLLGILKSKWKILCIDPEQQWAIIYFEKTLFTPDGYDVIAREKQLSQAQNQSIQLKLKELNVTGLTQI